MSDTKANTSVRDVNGKEIVAMYTNATTVEELTQQVRGSVPDAFSVSIDLDYSTQLGFASPERYSKYQCAIIKLVDV